MSEDLTTKFWNVVDEVMTRDEISIKEMGRRLDNAYQTVSRAKQDRAPVMSTTMDGWLRALNVTPTFVTTREPEPPSVENARRLFTTCKQRVAHRWGRDVKKLLGLELYRALLTQQVFLLLSNQDESVPAEKVRQLIDVMNIYISEET